MHSKNTYRFVTQNDDAAFEITVHTVEIYTNGELGEEQEEIEFAPIEEPIAPPVPATPAPQPVAVPA